VITCPKCSKDNQDHYKFCLGCGAELPREVVARPAAPQTPTHGVKAATGPVPDLAFPAPAPAAASPLAATAAVPPPQAQAAYRPPPAAQAAPAAAAPGTVACPQCGHQNGAANVFCGSCGFRLGGQGMRPAAAPAQTTAPASSVVLTALRADGSEAGTYAVPGGTQTVGRDTGGIFAGDSYLSPRHASFRQPAPGKLTVKDEGSLNGVYKKLTRDTPIELNQNDVFRIGQEIIRFEPLPPATPTADGVEKLGAPAKGYVGRIALVIGRDTTGNAFPVPEAGIHLGRERGDVLFPEDGYVSGLHCRIAWENGRATLTDLGSSNGSFIRLREETEVRSGDVLLMGQQLFRVTM
jgi:pSer/pThr/pTyr-binding forkhead associated (FHA) protein